METELTHRQRLLRRKHGTPEEFRIAVNKAEAALMVTRTEADIAIQRYNKQWEDAGYVKRKS